MSARRSIKIGACLALAHLIINFACPNHAEPGVPPRVFKDIVVYDQTKYIQRLLPVRYFSPLQDRELTIRNKLNMSGTVREYESFIWATDDIGFRWIVEKHTQRERDRLNINAESMFEIYGGRSPHCLPED